MAMKSIEVLSASETAYTLRRQLGPLLSWDDRLADMRRDKVHSGPILLPCAVSKMVRTTGPVYLPSAIREFVTAYRAYDPNANANIKLRTLRIEVDDADARRWDYRRLKITRIMNHLTA